MTEATEAKPKAAAIRKLRLANSSDVTGGNRVHELGLCVRVEDYRPEISHLHAHGDVVEFRADRVLHPTIGNQYPQRGKVGTDGH